MALIKTVRNFTPSFGQNCYLSENATIVGEVILGDDCSVWFNAVVRGDVNRIEMGNNVNIQDGAVIHCTYEKTKTLVGSNVSIGHNAIIHGCTIEDNVLIGMGAIIMDGAVIQKSCIVAAGSVITQNTIAESGFIYAGMPARKIKAVSEDLKKGEIERIANNYSKYASWFKTT
jgi:carbonic anhydrase/acetyltransferase-like protein (isoleucine patch superfamily)